MFCKLCFCLPRNSVDQRPLSIRRRNSKRLPTKTVIPYFTPLPCDAHHRKKISLGKLGYFLINIKFFPVFYKTIFSGWPIADLVQFGFVEIFYFSLHSLFLQSPCPGFRIFLPSVRDNIFKGVSFSCCISQ